MFNNNLQIIKLNTLIKQISNRSNNWKYDVILKNENQNQIKGEAFNLLVKRSYIFNIFFRS